MFDFNKFIIKINDIKDNTREYLTNNYLSVNQIIDISQNKSSFFIFNDNALVLYFIDNNIGRVLFNLRSLDKIEDLIELLNDSSISKPCVLECVGNERQLDVIKECFSKYNLELYSSFSRWRTSRIQNLLKTKKQNTIRLANLSDLKNIQAIFTEVFDPLVSHLPTDEKLKQLINEGNVYCSTLEGKVLGAYCCERVGKKSLYLYLDAVLKEVMGYGLGVLMLHYVLSKNNSYDDYNCWIEETNAISQKMHKHVGFKMDGIKNYIFMIR